jgi:hypothetical protein
VKNIVDCADLLMWILDLNDYMQMWNSAEFYPITKGVTIFVPYLIPQSQIIDLLENFVIKN